MQINAYNHGMRDSLDLIDRTLLRCLQSDGSLSAQGLSGKVNLTARATLMRIHRLEKRGWIQGYSARIDRRAIGAHVMLFAEIALRDQRPVTQQQFEERARQTPEVLACYLLSGRYDFLVRFCCRDLAHYNELTNRWLGDVSLGIEKIATLTELATIKEFAEIPIADG
jgi:Lrp/AsnC family transcriptional regulator, leucine-responsive regulatory protein